MFLKGIFKGILGGLSRNLEKMRVWWRRSRSPEPCPVGACFSLLIVKSKSKVSILIFKVLTYASRVYIYINNCLCASLQFHPSVPPPLTQLGDTNLAIYISAITHLGLFSNVKPFSHPSLLDTLTIATPSYTVHSLKTYSFSYCHNHNSSVCYCQSLSDHDHSLMHKSIKRV